MESEYRKRLRKARRPPKTPEALPRYEPPITPEAPPPKEKDEDEVDDFLGDSRGIIWDKEYRCEFFNEKTLDDRLADENDEFFQSIKAGEPIWWEYDIESPKRGWNYDAQRYPELLKELHLYRTIEQPQAELLVAGENDPRDVAKPDEYHLNITSLGYRVACELAKLKKPIHFHLLKSIGTEDAEAFCKYRGDSLRFYSLRLDNPAADWLPNSSRIWINEMCLSEWMKEKFLPRSKDNIYLFHSLYSDEGWMP